MILLKKILLIILLKVLLLNILYAKAKPEIKEELIKRTIAIMPFINKNNVEKYSYLADTIKNALKSKLLNFEQFDFINFNEIDDKILELGYTKESSIEEKNAKNIAVQLKADVFITGFYIIIEEKLMIQIDAFDIFTGKTVASSNAKGDVGLDIFRLIDEITLDMSEKLSRNLPKVTKTYFDEMMKVIKAERKFKFKESFTIQKKVGLGLTIGGGTLFLAGLPMIIYDFAGYSDIVNNNLYYNPRTDEGYNEYTRSYYTFTALFVAGIVSMSTGTILLGVGIPLLAIKFKKKDNVSFNIGIKNEICFNIEIRI